MKMELEASDRGRRTTRGRTEKGSHPGSVGMGETYSDQARPAEAWLGGAWTNPKGVQEWGSTLAGSTPHNEGAWGGGRGGASSEGVQATIRT